MGRRPDRAGQLVSDHPWMAHPAGEPEPDSSRRLGVVLMLAVLIALVGLCLAVILR